MPTDPRLGIPYPANTDANDVPRDIKAVVDKIGPIMAVDLQGTLSARPAAGVRGRYYTVSGDSSANNGRRFRDDGTVWVELPQAAVWQTFIPGLSQISGGPTPAVVSNQYRAIYTVVGPPSGRICIVKFRGVMSQTGSAGPSYGITLPIEPKSAGAWDLADGFGSKVQNVAGLADIQPIGPAGTVVLSKYDKSNLALNGSHIDSFTVQYEPADGL
jgi:hypothetical protein